MILEHIENSTKCGYVSLLGRPNAGKSTLLNACLGQKIAGVSSKPQTTRNKILGVDTFDENQIIFLDTPGIHRAKRLPQMNRQMNQAAWSVLADSDICCYLIDGKAGWHADDEKYLKELLKKAECPVVILISKTDQAKKSIVRLNEETIHAEVQKILSSTEFAQKEVIFQFSHVSAKRPESIQLFKRLLAGLLPYGEFLFAADDITDKSEKFVISELIREQAFRLLSKEIPYNLGVIVDKIDNKKENIVSVHATILVSRSQHKPILIGKHGSTLKRIGTAARENLERHFGEKVFLELYVQVADNWLNRDDLLHQIQGILEANE